MHDDYIRCGHSIYTSSTFALGVGTGFLDPFVRGAVGSLRRECPAAGVGGGFATNPAAVLLLSSPMSLLIIRSSRKVWGQDGVDPICNYDLTMVGIAGTVTAKGMDALHNPGNEDISLYYTFFVFFFYKNLFQAFSLSRCRCREAKKLSRAQLC